MIRLFMLSGLLLMGLVTWSGPAFGVTTVTPVEPLLQDDSGKKKKKTPIMRDIVYSKLSEAQTKAEEGNYAEAIKIMDKLQKNVDLNSYEFAQTYNIYAYIYFNQDDYPNCIAAYEELANQEDLPDSMIAGPLFTLAQLYFTTEKYQKSADAMERWFTLAEKPR